MGKGSTAIQSDIERQRAALSGRINRLEQRVRDDVQSVKTEAAGQVREVKESALATAGAAKDKVASAAASAKERVAERPAGDQLLAAAGRAGEAAQAHPLGTVTGALGVGAALGWLTGGGEDGHQRETAGRPHRSLELAGKGIEKGAGTISEVLRAEAAAFVKDFVDGTLHGRKAPGLPGQPAPLGSAWDRMQDRDLPRDVPRGGGEPPPVEEQIALDYRPAR